MADEALILLVEDDPRLRERLARFLVQEGFRVTAAENASDARAKLSFLNPDLMVLDVMMPGESGLQLTASLREQGNDIPVLLLTARGGPEDRISGFEAGADDYLGKPFEPRELLLRIRALMRRVAAPPPNPVMEPQSGPITIGMAQFDLDRGELRSATGVIRLTGGELALLTALARRPNEVLSREDIAAAVEMDEAGERAIDVQMTRLRRKIEVDPREPRFLHTVRGRGYVLKPGA